MKQLDLVGKRFEKYLVLSKAETSIHGTRWLCRCDCGTEKIVFGKHLTAAQG